MLYKRVPMFIYEIKSNLSTFIINPGNNHKICNHNL